MLDPQENHHHGTEQSIYTAFSNSTCGRYQLLLIHASSKHTHVSAHRHAATKCPALVYSPASPSTWPQIVLQGTDRLHGCLEHISIITAALYRPCLVIPVLAIMKRAKSLMHFPPYLLMLKEKHVPGRVISWRPCPSDFFTYGP